MNHILLLILGLIGLSISTYVIKKKSSKQPLVCHIGKNCEKVIYGKYGKTFGIENTIGGLFYYGLITLTGILMFFIPKLFEIPLIYQAEIIISGIAVLFSIYLTYIQGAVLKQWCDYCITSAIVSLLIFLVILF